MLGHVFFLAVLVAGADGDLTGGGVDRAFQLNLEAGTFLNEVIAQELEFAMLRELRGFVVDGAVFETKGEAADDTVGPSNLDEVTNRNGFAVKRANDQKTMRGTDRKSVV